MEYLLFLLFVIVSFFITFVKSVKVPLKYECSQNVHRQDNSRFYLQLNALKLNFFLSEWLYFQQIPDPFVRLYVGNEKGETAVRQRTNDPVFEEGFTFLVRNPRTQELKLEVCFKIPWNFKGNSFRLLEKWKLRLLLF